MKVQLDSNMLIDGTYCSIGEILDLADKKASPLIERGLVHKVETVETGDSSIDAILEGAVTATTKRRKRG